MRLFVSSIYIFITFLLIGCGGSSGSSPVKEPPRELEKGYTSSGLEIPINQSADEFKVLFFGNSHVGKMPTYVSQLIVNGLPHRSILTQGTPNALYLDERLNDQASLEALENEDWTHIIFQAQKYSQSGAVDYSTHAAKVWVTRAKEKGATPILFPEHPQIDDIDEGIRVYELHDGIAKDESACVSPIGYVWKKMLTLSPETSLYYPDGNHANEAGHLLSAMVFYEIITGQSADLLPYISEFDVDMNTQDLMGQIVSEVLTEMPACEY